jgi:hypothetical protein
MGQTYYLKTRKRQQAHLRDVAIPADGNVTQNKAEEKLIYVQEFMY